MARPMVRPGAAGFTLIEVLVALAILAVALGAAMRVAGSSVATAVELKQRSLALWVAQDRLAAHRVRGMRGEWSPPGSGEGETIQAGLIFRWRETVAATPHADFRRIEIRVSAGAGGDRVLVDLAGYLPRGR